MAAPLPRSYLDIMGTPYEAYDIPKLQHMVRSGEEFAALNFLIQEHESAYLEGEPLEQYLAQRSKFAQDQAEAAGTTDTDELLTIGQNEQAAVREKMKMHAASLADLKPRVMPMLQALLKEVQDNGLTPSELNTFVPALLWRDSDSTMTFTDSAKRIEVIRGARPAGASPPSGSASGAYPSGAGAPPPGSFPGAAGGSSGGPPPAPGFPPPPPSYGASSPGSFKDVLQRIKTRIEAAQVLNLTPEQEQRLAFVGAELTATGKVGAFGLNVEGTSVASQLHRKLMSTTDGDGTALDNMQSKISLRVLQQISTDAALDRSGGTIPLGAKVRLTSQTLRGAQGLNVPAQLGEAVEALEKFRTFEM